MRSKPAKSANRRRLWIVIVVAVVVLLGGAGAVVWKVKGTSSAATTTERTATVTKETIKDTVGATGTVQPKHQSEVSFTSSGTVTSVKVSVGTKVSKGQQLANIDTTDLKADLTAAQADYDAAQSDLLTAQADTATTTAELTAAKSKVAVDKSQVAQARAALAAATLRSPISGTVALVNIAKGDMVGSSTGGSSSGGSSSGGSSSGGSGAGSSSATGANSGGSGGTGSGTSSSASSADITVISTGTYTVDTAVGSSDVARIKKGMQATITVSGSTQPIFGTVSTVAVMANSTGSTTTGSTATFAVDIDVTGTQPNLYAGATATVLITVQQRPDVLTVPTAAVTTTNGQTTVTKLVGGQRVPTEITIGDSFGAITEVTKGLTEGDQVVFTAANRAAAGTGTRTGQGGTTGGTGRTGGNGFPTGGYPQGGGQQAGGQQAGGQQAGGQQVGGPAGGAPR